MEFSGLGKAKLAFRILRRLSGSFIFVFRNGELFERKFDDMEPGCDALAKCHDHRSRYIA